MNENQWAYLLERAGGETFVGRSHECRAFERFLDDPEAHLMHVAGPAGIGKTALLHKCCHLARERGWKTLWLDAATIDPEASKLEAALEPALESSNDDKLLIVVDAFDTWEGLYRWMRQNLLRRLPTAVRMLTAARAPLSDEWVTAPGWEKLIEIVNLGELSKQESLELLELRDVEADRRDAIVELTGGYPLALTVAADVVERHPERPFSYAAAARELQLLLRRLFYDAASAQQLQVLKLSALVRRTTEPLLAEALQLEDASDLLRWLSVQPFFDNDEEGFFPREPIRRLITDELHRFEPRARQELIHRAMTYYVQLTNGASGEAYECQMLELGYLLRDDVAPEWEPVEALRYSIDSPTGAEAQACVEAVRDYEGDESAEFAAFWQEQQPDGLDVVRDSDGQMVGFCHFIDVTCPDPQTRQLDPAVGITCDYLNRAPLREGQTVRICRFWMALDTYQDWSGVQTRIFLHSFNCLTVSSGVAIGSIVHSNIDRWANRSDILVRPYESFDLGDRQFTVFLGDWRKMPNNHWIQTIAEAATGKLTRGAELTPMLLTHQEFASAVKRGLKHYHRGDRLVENPLINTLLVLQHSGTSATTDERVEALRELLEEACHSLGETGGDRRHVEILERTYLQAQPKKQKAIADELDMAYSTLRHHLGRALDRVIEHLWAAERELTNV